MQSRLRRQETQRAGRIMVREIRTLPGVLDTITVLRLIRHASGTAVILWHIASLIVKAVCLVACASTRTGWSSAILNLA